MIPVEADLVIVDWSGIVHGAWHEAGPEGMIRRVAGELLDLLAPPKGHEGFPVGRLVLATDAGLPTHRHELTAHLGAPARYKAHRSRKPRDFWPLVERLDALPAALRIPTLAPADFAPQTWEADDSTATACRLARASGLSVLLVSRDKDWRQLVGDESPTVRWWSKMDAKLLDVAGVVGEHGVPPELLADWLALVGDTSDNIPGAEGIGPEKATALLRAWGSLAGVLSTSPMAPEQLATMTKALEQLRRERGRLAKAFADTAEANATIARETGALSAWKWLGVVHAQRAAVELSRKLVELRADAPIVFDPDEALVGGWNVAEVRRVLEQLGCGWLGRGVEARPKRAPRKGARSDGETSRTHTESRGSRGGQSRAQHPDRVQTQGEPRTGALPRPVRFSDGADDGAPQVGTQMGSALFPDEVFPGPDRVPLLPGEGSDGGLRGEVARGRHALLTGLCSYSGCATTEAHVQARALVAAILRTEDAPGVIAQIRRLAMLELAREEHAQLAIARWHELEKEAAA